MYAYFLQGKYQSKAKIGVCVSFLPNYSHVFNYITDLAVFAREVLKFNGLIPNNRYAWSHENYLYVISYCVHARESEFNAIE